ncbi:MAG: hypothetical protein F4Z28_09415, partial [Gammaproteobacteria bacterium]|nr:hypothetical protein [Gammaproteobacteria bacterium]
MGVIGGVALAVALASPQPEHADIKKSTTGICHCPGGQWYVRTSNYTPFETIEACLASGGREPERGQGECARGVD